MSYLQVDNLISQIRNPALPSNLQDASSPELAGAGFGTYIAILWLTALTLGGLAAVMYMLLGSLDWILAAGDKGKIEEARKKITQSIIGLAVLFSVGAITVVVGEVLGLNLLQPTFQSVGVGGGGGGGGNGGVFQNPAFDFNTPL